MRILTQAEQWPQRVAATYYHLTHNPDFQINGHDPAYPKVRYPSLYLTNDLDHWTSGEEDPDIAQRPYVAEVDVPEDLIAEHPDIHSQRELEIPRNQWGRLKVRQVKPRGVAR